MEYRFRLEKGSKKHHCPDCGKRRFVRYIDRDTGQYLPDQYGRCDREGKCSYHQNPYENGYTKMIREQERGNNPDWKPSRPKRMNTPQPKSEPIYFPVEVFNRTRSGYEKNVFIQNLLNRVEFPFDTSDVEKVISMYHLGTVQDGYRSGAITFPFIDVNRNIRTIQVKQFDKSNHTTGTDFLHSIIKKDYTRNKQPLPKWLEDYYKNELKVSCLFGEHLLKKYPNNPVALVEAPKTAIYGTLYFGIPESPANLLWLAVYNLSSLKLDKCKALKGRNVYLFPDLSTNGKAFDLWSENASEIQKQLPGTYFHVSDLLEQLAPEQDKEYGKDIADYLVKLDWRGFRKTDTPQSPPITSKSPVSKPLQTLSKPPSPNLNSNPENRELYNLINFPDDRKQNAGLQDNTPVAAINRTQSHQSQTITIQAGRSFEAFTNPQNELLILNPIDPERFTVYPSVESYNQRSDYPESRYKKDVDQNQLTPVFIDFSSLTIINN